MEDDLVIPEEPVISEQAEQTADEIDRMLNAAGKEPERKSPKLPSLAKMSTGAIVAGILDEAGVGMTDEERKKVAEISDEEAMAAFLEANLGTEPIVNEMKARSLFGQFMLQKMDIPAIGFATRFYNIRSTQECIEFAKGLCVKEGATIEDQVNAGKLWLTANREFSVMLKRFVDMASEVAPQGKPPVGKNQAPDIFVENAQILLQRPPSG